MYEDFLATRLYSLRILKKVSARDMSLSLGQNVNYVNNIENGNSLPSMTAFFYICEYFGITPKDFFDEGNSNPQKVNDIVQDLKQLDEQSLGHVAALVKGLCHK